MNLKANQNHEHSLRVQNPSPSLGTPMCILQTMIKDQLKDKKTMTFFCLIISREFHVKNLENKYTSWEPYSRNNRVRLNINKSVSQTLWLNKTNCMKKIPKTTPGPTRILNLNFSSIGSVVLEQDEKTAFWCSYGQTVR